MIAYIPARGGSKRIPKKNIKKLKTKPIIAHVIENLKQLPFLSNICVSTDDPAIQKIAESYNAMTLSLRSQDLSNDTADMTDLYMYDIPRFSEANSHDKEILLILATAALVPPEIYHEAYADYLNTQPEILMSCIEFPVSPYWAMTKKTDGYWELMFPDKIKYNSQDLPETLVDAGLFWFFNLDTIQKYEDLKRVDHLKPFIVDPRFSVDVDTPDDWKMLEMKYDILLKLSKETN